MNDKNNIWTDFLEFEEENNLFDIVDQNGTYVWDIVRYSVYTQILWNIDNSSSKRRFYISFNRIKYILTKELKVISFFFRMKKKKVLFFLASRNKIKGKLIDQNAYSILNKYSQEERLLIESYNFDTDIEYYKEIYPDLSSSFILYFVFHKKINYDFTLILKKILNHYPNSGISSVVILKSYQKYYFEKNIYKYLLKKFAIQKLFVTQNGIRKGIFSAAKELNIPVYEFQHGVVDQGHLAYSYPKMANLEDKVYLPNKIISLSNFWFKDSYLPSVEIIPLGNDFFYIEKLPLICEKAMLVISSDIFGESLAKSTMELIDCNVLDGYKIFFKLHPNQFYQRGYYEKRFEDKPNIIVVTNEKTVPELLQICSVVYAITSTAVYEALQGGRKVLLLSVMSYERHAHIFNHPNLYIVDTPSSVKEALLSSCTEDGNYIYFSKYKEISQEINKNESN